MNPNGENRWSKTELILVRAFLLFHLSYELIVLVVERITVVGHMLSVW